MTDEKTEELKALKKQIEEVLDDDDHPAENMEDEVSDVTGDSDHEDVDDSVKGDNLKDAETASNINTLTREVDSLKTQVSTLLSKMEDEYPDEEEEEDVDIDLDVDDVEPEEDVEEMQNDDEEEEEEEEYKENEEDDEDEEDMEKAIGRLAEKYDMEASEVKEMFDTNDEKTADTASTPQSKVQPSGSQNIPDAGMKELLDPDTMTDAAKFKRKLLEIREKQYGVDRDNIRGAVNNKRFE